MRKILSLLAVAVLTLSACGKSEEERLEERIAEGMGSKADFDLSKEQMTIKTEKGEKIEVAREGESLKAPDDFPKDIPIYKSAKIESSIKIGEATQLTLQTEAKIPEVMETYKAEMKKAGWEEKTAVQNGEMTMLQYSKDRRNAMVHIMLYHGGKTRIMLTVGEEEKE